ncbi:coiled-coil domain containing 86 [Cichlidogyrus casuarinus]|uniref:Coiled-coil domain-containing protein 86 n=1 Tax=Cichlidogyrus casuarinus TaxID=1844966 RepID=A0ABD2QJC5_9PLAT
MSDQINQIRGKPKSGRIWKDVRKQRYSANKQPKGIKKTYQQRMDMKNELQRRRESDKERLEARKAFKREKRQQEQEKRKRKEENIKKAEVVVPIKNLAKIKTMKKSQLRTITTR